MLVALWFFICLLLFDALMWQLVYILSVISVVHTLCDIVIMISSVFLIFPQNVTTVN